jgi:hypothetical protein
MDRIVDDLVENRKIFNEMKDDVSLIIKENDGGNDFNLTYDEFCSKCLSNIKNKDIYLDSSVKTVKQHFLEAMVEIAIEELEKRGRIEESIQIKSYLNK